MDGPATTSKLRDLKECRPIPIRKSLVLVNHFMVSTVRFMNRFCTLCEEKLSKVSHDVTRIETALAILEAKMNSIPDLDGVVGPEPVAADANAGAAAGASLGERVCGEGGGGGCVCVRFPLGKEKDRWRRERRRAFSRQRGGGGSRENGCVGVPEPPHPHPPITLHVRAWIDGSTIRERVQIGIRSRVPKRGARAGLRAGDRVWVSSRCVGARARVLRIWIRVASNVLPT